MINQKKLKVIFCGTPDFCIPALELLINHPEISLLKVISQPSRPAGRGYKIQPPPVVEFANSKNIPVFQTENINQEKELLDKIKKLEIDLIIVLAFSQFLGQSILDLPKLGSFNIHTSLLPKYRGAAPIQNALLNGDLMTGVSIQKMVKKMDAGDIAHLETLDISSDETGGQLTVRLKFLAALSLNNFLFKVLNNSLHLIPQNEEHVSFAPILKKEDGFINFEAQTCQEILNKIRAFHPWPGTYCFLNKKRLKIIEAQKVSRNVKPGMVETQFNILVIGCKDGSLRLSVLQLEGKKMSSDTELIRGIRGPVQINN